MMRAPKLKAGKPIRRQRLSTDNKLALRRVSSDVHVYNAYKWSLLEGQRKQKETHKWYRNLSPSGFSFDMCITTYFGKVETFLEFPLKSLMKISIGQGMHRYLGDIFKSYQQFLAPYPNPPNDPEPAEKRAKQHPEVICHYPKYHVRGKADLIPMIKRQPAIIDFKTTWSTDDDWDKFMDDPIIKKQWLCQLSSYAFIAEELGYYPDMVIGKLGIVAINLKRDPDRDDAWKELYWDWDDELRARIKALFEALLVGYDCHTAKKPVPCTNEECRQHGKSLVRHINVFKRDPRTPNVPSVRPDNEIHEAAWSKKT